MQLITDYFAAQKELHDYFGYVEDWKAIPMDDATEYFWKLDQDAPDSGGTIHYADSIEELDSGDGNCYSDEIYTQRFLPKFTYRGAEYTMIACDPHVDGNKFLRIFDNTKEIK